jgi:hypothetical protein
MSIGALSFLSPWLLAGLAALPVIYWLLRTVPPRPRQIAFPATRILVGLEERENTPARTPWWLTLIRMLAAALVIFALADPVWNPNRESALSGGGPVVLVVDNGWGSAARWPERTRMIDRLITEAESRNRPVLVVPTAARTPVVRIETPTAARSTAAAIQPQPHAPRRAEAATALEAALANQRDASVIWLTDGLDHDGATRAFADRLAARAGGGFWVVVGGAGEEPLGLSAGLARDGKLEAHVHRGDGSGREGIVHAYSAKSQRLGEARFRLEPGEGRTSAIFELPLELRNQVTRLEIAGERSAGAVQLLDARAQWQRVAMLSGASLEQAQPLLGPLYYVERALSPFAEVIDPRDANLAEGVDQALAQNASIVVMADIGTLPPDQKTKLEEWVGKGGVLVRFAGPRLEKGGDDLLPAPLRLGGRTLGGALSWSIPQPLAPFGDDSLFAGLAIPADVTVNRQVLADPARLDGGTQVWARLRDGTPLVTALRRGDGHVVLFHVTANSDWSNLPLSGLFVEMLRRVTTLGKLAGRRGGEANVNATGTQESQRADMVLSPFQVLDGFGLLRPPPPTAQPIAAKDIATVQPSPDNPPGYYGPQDAPSALNVLTPASQLRPLPALPSGAERRAYESGTTSPLKPSLFVIALALLLVDMIAVLLLQWGGRLFGGRRARTASTAIAVLVAGGVVAGAPHPAAAQTVPVIPPNAQSPAQNPRVVQPGGPLSPAQDLALRATRVVTLGYVVTGDADADRTSRMGLTGLGRVLTARTAIEPGDPFPVNIQNDDIAFFPILYWPVLSNARPLDDATLVKIDAYMKQGGMIIFDTRDFGQGLPSGLPLAGRDGTPLQRLLGRLDIPRLEPVPDGHVMTKAFYLIRTFPGRWDGGQLWVEAEAADADGRDRQSRQSDGVSSVLVTSNDFASAWALDEQNRPVFPVVPGGEPQRELAFRTGVNIVMYALTGNYKADQVHVPALLERLGQ